MLQDESSTASSPQPSPRDAAVAIVQTLQANHHVAYFAGGCVRDALLGLSPKDYDVATSALPQQVASLFRNTQFVGEAFGVTLVRTKKHAIEVATFRKEWGYQDGRRPTQVEFSDAKHDALRRDFTINGLFENPLATDPACAIIDYVQGLPDLQSKTLRAIGNPDDRFAEDYLRMLRAARFAARLGFTLEEKTARAITNNARYLGQISRERIGQEIMAMLTPDTLTPDSHTPAPLAIVLAVELIQTLRLDGPTLNTEHKAAALPTLQHLTQLLSSDSVHATAIDYPACLLAWLVDRAYATNAAAAASTTTQATADHPLLPQWLVRWLEHDATAAVSRWRRSLMLSNAVHEAMNRSISLLLTAKSWSDMSVAQRKRLLANMHWPRTHALLAALAHEPCIKALTRQIDGDAPALIASGIAPAILITGDDLIQLGQKPGPLFRRLLDQAYDLQLEGKITTHQDAIVWLKKYLES